VLLYVRLPSCELVLLNVQQSCFVVLDLNSLANEVLCVCWPSSAHAQWNGQRTLHVVFFCVVREFITRSLARKIPHTHTHTRTHTHARTHTRTHTHARTHTHTHTRTHTRTHTLQVQQDFCGCLLELPPPTVQPAHAEAHEQLGHRV